MALESATYINGLVSTNPTSGDPKSQGDDHLRLIKAAVKATFPNITGAMTLTHTELNRLDEFSLGSNGYQKFPSGLIVQWGGGTTNGSGLAVVSMPIAFPTTLAAYSINTATVNATTRSVGSTTTSLSIEVRSDGALVAGASVTWIALGY